MNVIQFDFVEYMHGNLQSSKVRSIVLSPSQLVAMGRSTEARLKEMDLTVSGVSKSPKPDSLLAVIKTLVTQTAA